MEANRVLRSPWLRHLRTCTDRCANVGLPRQFRTWGAQARLACQKAPNGYRKGAGSVYRTVSEPLLMLGAARQRDFVWHAALNMIL